MHQIHWQAAEQHQLAAQVHRTAAEYHEQAGDRNGDSERALEYATDAYKTATEAQDKSGQFGASNV